mgnify:CR=1 FL=1
MTQNNTLSLSNIIVDLQLSKSSFMFLFLRTVLSRLFFVLWSSLNYYLTQNHKQNVYFT